MADNRRDFLRKGSLLGLSGLVSGLFGKTTVDNIEQASNFLTHPPDAFTLLPLPYAYDALEPFIDKQTMEIHYTKHHKGYVDKLNATPSTNLDYQADDETKCKSIDAATSSTIRNNLGGHYNHSLFWQLLKPNPQGQANLPSGLLADAINRDFKSFDEFKKEFSDKALKVFGSGWCWLILDDQNKLKITTTPNQDNPLMPLAAERGRPIMALDVWEHAYYLKHQNKRVDYITAWWNVANWEKAAQRFNGK